MDERLRWAMLGVLVTLPAGFVVGFGADADTLAGHAAAGSGVALLGAVLGVVIGSVINVKISEARARERARERARARARERQTLRDVAERERRGD